MLSRVSVCYGPFVVCVCHCVTFSGGAIKCVSGGYVVTHLRHTFTQSGQLKHKIIMRVAKDSKKGKPLPNSGVPFTYSDSNKSRTVNVSAGYSAGDDYTVA